MHAYVLTRDDGTRMEVNENAWETALELACLYGWKPAGTESPHIPEWHARTLEGPALWDSQDYFSRKLQRVGQEDSHALAAALARALRHIPELALAPDEPELLSLLPTRASAVNDGLSRAKRNAIGRFAAFASRGGFTIEGSP